MPDSHEQFAAWWNASEQEELRKSCAMGWGKYIWQASRAALKVELPLEVYPHEVDHMSDLPLFHAGAVEEALQQAGIEVVK